MDTSMSLMLEFITYYATFIIVHQLQFTSIVMKIILQKIWCFVISSFESINWYQKNTSNKRSI